jgi:superfamily II DNA or RNA helicase
VDRHIGISPRASILIYKEKVTFTRATAAFAKRPLIAAIRLYTERLLVRSFEVLSPRDEETEVPVVELSFEYDGTCVSASDERGQFFVADSGSLAMVERDAEGEERARRILESFGAVELSCLDAYTVLPDSKADYLVQLDGNEHAWCSFTAYAVPQLRALGFRVEIDPGYRYQVVDGEPPFYSHVHPDEKPDWFGLELGVEIDGRRVNLMPALLDLLDASQGAPSLQSLRSMPARFRAVRIDEHRCLVVPADRLGKLLEVLIELYHGERSASLRLEFQALEAASLVRLEEAIDKGFGRLARSGASAIRERGRALAALRDEKVAECPAWVTATLRPYQAEGLSWLQRLRVLGVGGVLADDMGLGKTLQTIALLAGEKQAGRIDKPSLLVMPTSLIGNWQREIAKFAPSLRVTALHGPKRRSLLPAAFSSDIVLTTYPLLLRDLALFQNQHFYYLVLDEAQVIKNRKSLVTRAVTSLEADHRLCLTGTPIENSLEELWSLFEFLMPGLLGSAEQFRARFRPATEGEESADELAALRARVAPFVLRRMKEQVAKELPPKTEIVRPVAITGAQRELYENIRIAAHSDVRRAIQKLGIARSTIPILDALMKLRQVCCDPRLVPVDAARAVRKSAKYDCFFELLTQQLEKGRRVLVFSQFTRMLALLADGMRERSIRYVALTGSTLHRQRPIDEFSEGKVDVFLISLKAGGTGLNLTSADTVIHYDPWWNPAAQAQATDRAYRIGQTRPVFVYSLIVAGSVEERMLALQQRKRNLAEAIIGSPREGPRISSDDLDRLFLPLAGAADA